MAWRALVAKRQARVGRARVAGDTLHGERPVSRTRQRHTAYLMLHLGPALSYVTRYKRFAIYGKAQLEPA